MKLRLTRRALLGSLATAPAIVATLVSPAPAESLDEAVMALLNGAKRHGVRVRPRNGDIYYHMFVSDERTHDWAETFAELSVRVERHPGWRARLAEAAARFDWE